MRQYNPFSTEVMTPVVKWIIIINVVLHIIKLFFDINLDAVLGLNYGQQNFFWFQYLTHMFMHSSMGISHILFNMLMLWMFGSIIENILGSKRFLMFYLICGLGAAFTFQVLEAWLNDGPLIFTLIGASGAVYGVMFAFAYLYPNMRIYVYFILPVKAKYLIVFAALISIWLGFQNNQGDNVAHFAHLGGMIFAFILLKYWKIPRVLY